MAKYKDSTLLQRIGARLKYQREKKRFLKVDVACKTGFTPKTIMDIEEGNEISLSYFTEVCKALEIHPKEIFDIEITLEPRNECDPRKNRITNGVKELIEDGYFKEARISLEVKDKLKKEYDIETTTSNISVILKRQVNNEFLVSEKSEKNKRSYLYIKREKN